MNQTSPSPRFPAISFLLGCLLLLALFPAPAQAQFNVNLEVKRRTYLRYEPILATISIQNLAGRDVTLEDGASPWFGFTVMQGTAATVISPRNPDYHLSPIEIKLGETLKRTVNLMELFPINELGTYRVRANIYVSALDKYFPSRTANIEVEDGRPVWKQLVGVPDTLRNAGAMHEFQLVSTMGLDHNYLYVRVTEPDTGKVYACNRIGHLLDDAKPEMQFDTTNTLHVLLLTAPKTYTLTEVGVNGEFYGQWTYDAPKYKPALRRDNTGGLEIVGATRRAEPVAGATPGPKLSDRPPGLPK